MSDLADDTAGALSVEVYRRAALIVSTSSVICDCQGFPLNELQQNAITQAVIESMDGLASQLARLLTADACLRTGNLKALLDERDA